MKIAIRTYAGLEEILQAEIHSITGKNASIQKRAVSIEGNMEDVYKINLWSRFSIDVLVHLHSFKASHENILYKYAHQIEWEKYMTKDQTFSISSIVHSRFFTHSQYVALKIKDALVDRFRKIDGSRPDVDKNEPDMQFVVRISDDKVNILWNTSGTPLFKRGYRKLTGEAPLNEVVAASILEFSGWDQSIPLIDPMCGSGTFVAEAIMKSYNIAPGILRNRFGFEKSNEHDPEIWDSLKEKAKNNICQSSAIIYGYDISLAAVSMTKENIKMFDPSDKIKIEQSDYFNLSKPEEEGMLIMNPPYDQRLKNDHINELYNNIGSRLKHFWENYNAWILSGNLQAIKHIGLKPKRKKTLFNGPLECKLIYIPIYKGSLKKKKE
jgi:putative N6-adenine-specific DNA methylase